MGDYKDEGACKASRCLDQNPAYNKAHVADGGIGDERF